MSSALSCVAIAAMVAVGLVGPPGLRVPSLNALSCASMYAERCAARFGIVSLTLTPLAPWHAAHTCVALALPASISAAPHIGTSAGASAAATSKPSRCFIEPPLWPHANTGQNRSFHDPRGHRRHRHLGTKPRRGDAGERGNKVRRRRDRHSRQGGVFLQAAWHPPHGELRGAACVRRARRGGARDAAL